MYSSKIVAVHACKPCATFVLLFASDASDTLPCPHPSHRGVGCVNYILHRASYRQRTYSGHTRGGVGGLLAWAIYMISKRIHIFIHDFTVINRIMHMWRPSCEAEQRTAFTGGFAQRVWGSQGAENGCVTMLKNGSVRGFASKHDASTNWGFGFIALTKQTWGLTIKMLVIWLVKGSERFSCLPKQNIFFPGPLRLAMDLRKCLTKQVWYPSLAEINIWSRVLQSRTSVLYHSYTYMGFHKKNAIIGMARQTRTPKDPSGSTLHGLTNVGYHPPEIPSSSLQPMLNGCFGLAVWNATYTSATRILCRHPEVGTGPQITWVLVSTCFNYFSNVFWDLWWGLWGVLHHLKSIQFLPFIILWGENITPVTRIH